MSRYTNLKRLAINQEGFVFDPQTGTSFVINGTAERIINGLKNGDTEEQIITDIIDRYFISEEQAGLDVGEFMEKLKLYKLVD